jgi:PIN domain nuclease of toxin-antitoxin system
MNILLDTHAFLWYLNGDENLSDKARKSIEKKNSVIYISIASIWEISIKIGLKKLKIDVSLEELENQISLNNFIILPIKFEHIIELSKLDYHHRDPFDRILIAQSLTEKITVITKDDHFNHYKGINSIW